MHVAMPCVYSIHMRSREVIKALMADDWQEVRQTGSHKHFRHPTKPGTVTVPHPDSDMAIGTLKSIERQRRVQSTRTGAVQATLEQALD